MVIATPNCEMIYFLFQWNLTMEKNIKSRSCVGKFAADALKVTDSVGCPRSFQEDIASVQEDIASDHQFSACAL